LIFLFFHTPTQFTDNKKSNPSKKNNPKAEGFLHDPTEEDCKVCIARGVLIVIAKHSPVHTCVCVCT
jgi:hypothetical protein